MKMSSSRQRNGRDEEQRPLIESHDNTQKKHCLSMEARNWLRQISLPVYVMVMLFAMSSWIDINGLWVELPLLVNALPEGWNLPSYLAVIIQVANIGPITYTVANRLAPQRVKEWPVIYAIITVGAAACLILAFTWKLTAVIAGAEHSVALIALTALLAIVDCTSSVVYLPYMAVFKPQYMTALYIGEGFSGLIPGLVGLAQSVGADPDCVNKTIVVHNATTGENHTEHEIVPVYPPIAFSVEVFFFFLFAMMLVSGVSFSLLHWLPYSQRQRLEVQMVPVESSHFQHSKANSPETPETGHHHQKQQQMYGSDEYSKVANDTNDCIHSKEPLQQKDSQGGLSASSSMRSHELSTNRDEDGRDPYVPRLSPQSYYLLLALTGWLNALTNGILASTGSFSILPYGNLAYSLAVRLSAVANPLACLLALFVVCRSVACVAVLTTIGSGLAVYQVYLAATSPLPPLIGTVLGQMLAVITSIMMTGIFSYVKVSIASILRTEGRRALLWCGVITQVGSFTGAVIAFVLVNVLNLFTSIPPCAGYT